MYKLYKTIFFNKKDISIVIQQNKKQNYFNFLIFFLFLPVQNKFHQAFLVFCPSIQLRCMPGFCIQKLGFQEFFLCRLQKNFYFCIFFFKLKKTTI